MHGLILAFALPVALLVDRFVGEPPATWHPVVAMGRYLQWAGAWVQRGASSTPADTDWLTGVRGAVAWCAGAALVWSLAWAVQTALSWPLGLGARWDGAWDGAWDGRLAFVALFALAALAFGLALKPLMAWALLANEVLAVETALEPARGGSLEQGRERLRWLVSRDVAVLSESQVRESAIETLAENLNDSVVAPLFWFVCFGLPGAALYRFANTADAMWGYPGLYQGQNWAWAGKWAARADDVLSWLPARLTAWALLLLGAGQGRLLWGLRQQARQTPSPNSGWPMAAMALALDVALHKPGVYVLNPEGRSPTATDTHRALRVAGRTVWVALLLTLMLTVAVAFGWGELGNSGIGR